MVLRGEPLGEVRGRVEPRARRRPPGARGSTLPPWPRICSPWRLPRARPATTRRSAGGRAIEAVQDAAAPLRGARVLHVSAAGRARAGARSCSARVLPLAAGAGLAVEWRVLFADPELRRVARRARARPAGRARARSTTATGRPGPRPASGSGAASTAPRTWSCCTTPARSGSRPGSTCRRCGAATSTRRARRTRRSSASARVARALALTLVPHESFAPAGLRDDRLQRGAARDRPARPAQPRARAAAPGPRGAPAGRGPRAAVPAPGGAARPLGRSARGDRGVPARQGRGAGPAARARRACSTRARRTTGGRPRRCRTSRRATRTCCC